MCHTYIPTGCQTKQFPISIVRINWLHKLNYKKLSYRRETARQLPTWRGARPSSPLPRRPQWLYLCIWSSPKPTTNVLPSTKRTLSRGGSSKLIDRGSDRVKGASGVFRMREKGARRSVGQKSPSGVRGKAPVRGLGDEVPRSWSFFVNECLNFDLLG